MKQGSAEMGSDYSRCGILIMPTSFGQSPGRDVAPAQDAFAWMPLLEGGRAVRAAGILADIESALKMTTTTDPSLANGLAGEALFWAYLDRAMPGLGKAEVFQARLAAAIDGLEALPLPASLYAGFTGVAWVVEHLAIDAAEGCDGLEVLDDAILAHLAASPWRWDYDLILGLVGYGLYGLERAPRDAGPRIIEQVLDHLAAAAIPMGAGVTWLTPPGLLPEWQRRMHPRGYYNLGLAHGVPGVIAFLGAACSQGHGRARQLLRPAVAWLLEQRSQAGGCFPSFLPAGSPGSPQPSRVAWCYGDLGVSIGLMQAARHAGERGWEREAVEIAKVAAARPLAEAGAQDAGLCHGAAGNAHLFNRLYQATGEGVFLDAALSWFDFAMDLHRPGAGIGGYRAWQPGPQGGDPWRANAGLLEGAAGIGLALLAGLHAWLPQWDRMLMVDLPPTWPS